MGQGSNTTAQDHLDPGPSPCHTTKPAHAAQVPSDAQMHRLRARAAGYQDWELGIRAQLTPSRVRSGPVRLRATGVRGA